MTTMTVAQALDLAVRLDGPSAAAAAVGGKLERTAMIRFIKNNLPIVSGPRSEAIRATLESMIEDIEKGHHLATLIADAIDARERAGLPLR